MAETGSDDSAIYLPLRTSVELFSDPEQPAALVRAKQAAVLHDRLYVETGYLDVSITDSGSMAFWTPPDQITDEQIARARKLPEPGTPMVFAMGKESTPGEAASEMHAVVSGPLAVAYGAEWHSGVIDPLSALGVDWLREVTTGGNDISRQHPIGAAIAQQNYRDWTDKELLPGMNTFRRDFIYKSFNRDAAVAQDLDAAFQVTTLFEPMVQRRGYNATAAGGTALEIIAPNLAGLDWEVVLEFRDHPGAQEARGLMREFERLALAEEPTDAVDYLMKVAQEVANGLLAPLHDQRTKIPRAVAEEAAKTGIALIPGVGPFIEKGITAAQLAAQKVQERRSGIAALMRLRK